MKLRLIPYLLGFLFSFNTYALGLNDLSILVPLPKTSEFKFMISPYEVGTKGSMLSESVFQRMIQMVPEYDNVKVWKGQLKVVAIRLDPCFIEGVGPLECSRQVRLVWQPVILEGNELSTRDTAIHSFYEFTEAEYTKVLTEWKRWAKTDSNSALVVHPLLQKQGLSGAGWSELRSIILKNCGEKNIIRMTLMNVMADEQMWIFSGFDIFKDGSSKEMVIPRLKTVTQAITNTSFNFKTFTGGMTPNPLEDNDFNLMVEDSSWFKRKSTENQVRMAIRSAIGFENPKKHNTGTLDCASCHLANMAHSWAETNFPQMKWGTEFNDVKYQSEFNLNNPTKKEMRPNQFRIFGYFGKEPAISQRVINETAAVAEYLKSK